jgi:DNA-binding transcriptional regulator YiaG
MTPMDRALSALSLLASGKVSEAIEAAAQVSTGDPLHKLLGDALKAGFALAQAGANSEPPPAEAMGIFRLLAAAPVAAEGFRTIRESFGITQAEVAEVCGVSSDAVSTWECGKVSLPPAAVDALQRLMVAHLDPMAAPLFGRDLRRLRKMCGMRQADFAAALGVSEPAIKKWEQHGDRPLTPSTVRRIRQRYNALQAEAAKAA